jgi:hypothetical protein
MPKRRIALPLLVDPWTGKECLVLFMKPTPDARPGVPPTYCKVVGLGPMGDDRIYEFSVPLADYTAAARNPITFLECDDLSAPIGVVLDRRGAVIRRS